MSDTKYWALFKDWDRSENNGITISGLDAQTKDGAFEEITLDEMNSNNQIMILTELELLTLMRTILINVDFIGDDKK